jgi:hypothetical protein
MKNHTGSVSALPMTMPQVCGSLRMVWYDSRWPGSVLPESRSASTIRRSSAEMRGCVSGL